MVKYYCWKNLPFGPTRPGQDGPDPQEALGCGEDNWWCVSTWKRSQQKWSSIVTNATQKTQPTSFCCHPALFPPSSSHLYSYPGWARLSRSAHTCPTSVTSTWSTSTLINCSITGWSCPPFFTSLLWIPCGKSSFRLSKDLLYGFSARIFRWFHSLSWSALPAQGMPWAQLFSYFHNSGDQSCYGMKHYFLLLRKVSPLLLQTEKTEKNGIGGTDSPHHPCRPQHQVHAIEESLSDKVTRISTCLWKMEKALKSDTDAG